MQELGRIEDGKIVEQDGMTIFIPWSGGYDSTLLLYENALENPNELINAITVLNLNNNDQEKAEAKARKQLKKQLKLPNIRYHTIRIDYTNTPEEYQISRWFSTLIPVLDNGDELCMAYLGSDGVDFFALKPEFETAFNAFMDLRQIKCTLSFPFMYKTKGYVIKELKKAELLKYVWTCGKPKKGKPCGKCMKCISIKRWTAYPDKGDRT